MDCQRHVEGGIVTVCHGQIMHVFFDLENRLYAIYYMKKALSLMGFRHKEC